MIEPGTRVVIGCSGGQDSVTLTHLLHRLRDELACDLAIATLDHGLRGDQGRADVAFVRALGDSLGLTVHRDTVDCAALAQQQRVSAPVAARTARHEFLRRVAADIGATRIALGHTADDQAETVLMHLLRGAGLDGLAGMLPVRPPYIRPLLGCWRVETEAYCRNHGLAFRADPSNRDPRHLRVRVRERLLPLLASEYQPRIKEHLVALAADCADDTAVVEHEADEARRKATAHPDGSVTLSAELLRKLPPSLRRRVVRAVLADLRGARTDLTRDHLHAVDALLAPGARTVEVPGVLITRDGGTIRFAARGAPAEALTSPDEVTLIVPGRTRVEGCGIAFDVRVVSTPPADPTTAPTRALLDRAAASGALVVRTRRPGDRFHPLGAPGSKSLQDFFVNAKVPRSQRDRVPLVLAGDRIAWVVGYRIADDFRITPETTDALEVTVHPLESPPGTP